MPISAAVYLVDDDSAFLAAMGRFLRASGFTVVTCDSAADLLSRVSPETRGCVVADLDMPGVGGLELQALLSGREVAMPMVFLTGHGDIPSSVRAMRGGAVDFLEKLAPQEQLVAAITRALEREAESHAAWVRQDECRRRLAALTAREREVLALVVSGKMNKQIAAALGIHERTVKLHRTGITSKLGVHAVAQLALLATEARLVDKGLPSAIGRGPPGRRCAAWPGAAGASPKGSGGGRASDRNVGNSRMRAPDPAPVAIIDDDESLCRSLGRLLRQSGFHPYLFLSARDFLDSPDRAGLRCLLIDIQLGDTSGIDLHRQLLATGDATPVIYITAHTDPAVRIEAQRVGCAGFFMKTDPASAIVEVLRRVTA